MRLRRRLFIFERLLLAFETRRRSYAYICAWCVCIEESPTNWHSSTVKVRRGWSSSSFSRACIQAWTPVLVCAHARAQSYYSLLSHSTRRALFSALQLSPCPCRRYFVGLEWKASFLFHLIITNDGFSTRWLHLYPDSCNCIVDYTNFRLL